MTRTGGCARRTWFPRQVSAEARTQILADGPEHVINAVAVRVHPFHRRSYAEVSDAEDVDEGAVARGSHQNDPIEDASASEVTALYKTYAMGGGESFTTSMPRMRTQLMKLRKTGLTQMM